MAAQYELEPIASQLPVRQSPMESASMSLMAMIDYAVKNQSAIEVIKELRAMQQEDRAYNAQLAFDEAMKAAQNEISTVIPDADNEQTLKKYASFKALNAAIRPVYLRHGFSLSFNGAPSPVPEEIYVLCACAHSGGCTKPYMIPMSTDSKGPKGGGVMSKQQAYSSASSYGRSVLLKLIFNIAIGEPVPKMEGLQPWIDELKRCETLDGLDTAFKKAYNAAESEGDKAAMFDLIQAKANRRSELQKAKK